MYSKSGMIVSERNTDSPFNQVISGSFEIETKALAINLVYRSPNSTAENNKQFNELIRHSIPKFFCFHGREHELFWY